MPSLVDLLEKIAEQRRQDQQSANSTALTGVQVDNGRTAGASANFDLQQKQTALAGDMELARRTYPDLDPLEALVKWKADEGQKNQDLKDESLRSLQAQREAYAEAARMRADVSKDKLTITPEEQAAAERKAKYEEARNRQTELMNDRILQEITGKYTPHGPAATKAGTKKEHPIHDKDRLTAYAQLKAEHPGKGYEPTPAEVRARAVMNVYGVEEGVPTPPAAGGGGTVAPTPPTGPVNVNDEAEARVKCAQFHGTLLRKPDGNFKCIGGRP